MKDKEIAQVLAHAKRVAIMAEACVLMTNPTLEWDSSFTFDIRLWILGHLAKNLDENTPGHWEAYELARLLLGKDDE